jgi:mRNA-degrading endonuclease RelE of RelBE toxin-antitoxin system
LAKFAVVVERKAKKQFKRMPKEQQKRILAALAILEAEGLSNKLDIKKLRGFMGHYRIRVGRLVRILFELAEDRSVIVYSISTREKAYE